MTWQPIKTAPKGEKVLVIDGDEICTLAFIGHNGEWISSDFAYLFQARIWDWEDKITCNMTDEEMDKAMLLEYPPTHWMPLPEPPKLP